MLLKKQNKRTLPSWKGPEGPSPRQKHHGWRTEREDLAPSISYTFWTLYDVNVLHIFKNLLNKTSKCWVWEPERTLALKNCGAHFSVAPRGIWTPQFPGRALHTNSRDLARALLHWTHHSGTMLLCHCIKASIMGNKNLVLQKLMCQFQNKKNKAD